VLSLGLLQPVKGAVVAMQWQMGMHGFAKAKSERERARTQVLGLPLGLEQRAAPAKIVGQVG
jgi:hypothetical protein